MARWNCGCDKEGPGANLQRAALLFQWDAAKHRTLEHHVNLRRTFSGLACPPTEIISCTGQAVRNRIWPIPVVFVGRLKRVVEPWRRLQYCAVIEWRFNGSGGFI